MKCPETLEQLSAYIDGALDEAARASVELHLRACPACAKEHAELAACIEQMRALPEKKAPADLARRVHERLAPRVSLPYRLAGIAAGLLLVVIAADVVRETRQNVPLSSVVPAPRTASFSAGTPQAGPATSKREIPAAATVRDEAPALEVMGGAAPSEIQQADGLALETVAEQKHDFGVYPARGLVAKNAVARAKKADSVQSMSAASRAPVQQTVIDLRVHAQADITDATRSELSALVEKLQGTVLDFDFAAPLPAMMAARIPSGRLQELAAGLSRFGTLEKTPSQPVRGPEYLTVIISLVPRAQ